MVIINAYDAEFEDHLKLDEEYQQNKEVTVRFCQEEEYPFDYEATLDIAEFINNNSKKLKVMKILLMGSATTDYLAANVLVQAIQGNKNLMVQVGLEIDLINTPKETLAFLRSVGPSINGLSILSLQSHLETPLGVGSCEELAGAIALLPNLSELSFGRTICSHGSSSDSHNDSNPIPWRLAESVLLECVHQNKVHLNKLWIYATGHGLPGIGMYLQSEAASRLDCLEIYTNSFQRKDAIALTTGLKQNPAVSVLAVDCRQTEDSNVNDFDGISILCSYLQEEESLQSLHFSDGGSNVALLDALQSKTNLKKLDLGCIDQIHGGPALKQLLLTNHVLDELNLKFHHTESFNQHLVPNLALGFLQNQGIRSFKLEFDDDRGGGVLEAPQPDVSLNISVLVDALRERYAQHQLHHLAIKLPCNPITDASWASLTQFLECPESQLKSVSLKILCGTTDNVCGLIRSIRACPTLQKAELEFMEIENGGAEDYTQIYTEALGKATSPKLTDITVRLHPPIEGPLEEQEVADMKQQILTRMEANTQLEHVVLGHLSRNGVGGSNGSGDVAGAGGGDHDYEFQRSMQSHCMRNKGTNAAAFLKDGTLQPSGLPEILDSIEYDCDMLGTSKDTHFVNIWFALVQSHPIQVAKYFPSDKGEEDEDNEIITSKPLEWWPQVLLLLMLCWKART